MSINNSAQFIALWKRNAKKDEVLNNLNCNWKSIVEKNKTSILGLLVKLWKNESKVNKDKILNTLKKMWENLNYPQKEEILKMLADSWELLEESENDDKKHLWSNLSEIQKAELLEFFSRRYTMAHAVFVARRIIKEKYKDKYKDVYIQLEDPDQSFIDKWKNKDTVGTVIINDQKSKPDILRCKIYYYSPDVEMASYDKGYISKKCKRFVICHEIAHIILHIQDIIDDKMQEVCIFPFNKRSNIINSSEKDEKLKEDEADIFAEMLSDLRDRHVLMRLSNPKLKENQVKSEIDLCNEYRSKKISDERFKHIIEEVVNLNNLSKNHTLSNSIFAIKKIISIYEIKNKPSNTPDSREEQTKKLETEARKKRDEWNHGIQVYPYRRNRTSSPESNFVSIIPFGSRDIGDAIGYNIAPPKQEMHLDAEDIAKALGALALCYEKIKDIQNTQGNQKNRKTKQILVNETNFPNDFDNFEVFSKALREARNVSVRDVVENIKHGSGKRIINPAIHNN